MDQEHRQHIRINESMTITYKILKGLASFSSKSQNLSEGGICLPAYQRLDEGLVLELAIYFPENEHPLTVRGQVIWRKDNPDKRFPFLVGIKIMSIDPAAKERLTNYVKRQSGDNKTIGWIE